ncbi:hypothetical protein HGB07_01600 [Candidatus Roizmanbacteria bacterium]|nr:hypothetical protein [Candidatus Roizmanbacteria bacterium]
MPLAVTHSIVLIVTIVLSFLVAASPLKEYELQIIAFLFIILFISKRTILSQLTQSRLLESVVFTFVVISTVTTSGGVSSPLFFLNYFLLFSLCLLLEPTISIVTTLSLALCYTLSLPPDQGLKMLIPIASLAFLTPFALYLGQLAAKTGILQRKLVESDTDSILFLSLLLKNHIKSIKYNLENFMGDHQLHEIRKHTHRLEVLIEQYEERKK